MHLQDQFINLDVTEDAKSLVRLIQSLDQVRKNNVTILQVVDIYKGSNVSNISYKLGSLKLFIINRYGNPKVYYNTMFLTFRIRLPGMAWSGSFYDQVRNRATLAQISC